MPWTTPTSPTSARMRTLSLRDAMAYSNEEILFRLLPGLKRRLKFIDYEVSKDHQAIMTKIYQTYPQNGEQLTQLITEAAYLRRFLG